MVNNMANHEGYTLIETIMVMIILSTLSAISYPTLMNWAERAEFKAEVSNFVGALRRAKMEAIKTNSIVVIEVSPYSYTIFMDNSSTPKQAGNWSRQPDERLLIDRHIKKGLTVCSNFEKNKARFSCKPGMTAGRFIFTNTQKMRMEVIINTVGRIRVEGPISL